MQKAHEFTGKSLEKELSKDYFIQALNACVNMAKQGFEANFKVFLDPKTNNTFYSPEIYLYKRKIKYASFNPDILGPEPDFYLDFPSLDFGHSIESNPEIPTFIDFYTNLRNDFLKTPLFLHLDELNSHRANNKCLPYVEDLEIIRPLGIILNTKLIKGNKNKLPIKFYFENTPKTSVLQDNISRDRFSVVGGIYNLENGRVLSFPSFYNCDDLIRYDNANDEFEDC